MVKNKYIDTLNQKGSIQGFSGIWNTDGCPQPADPGGQGEQRQSNSCLAQLGQLV